MKQILICMFILFGFVPVVGAQQVLELDVAIDADKRWFDLLGEEGEELLVASLDEAKKSFLDQLNVELRLVRINTYTTKLFAGTELKDRFFSYQALDVQSQGLGIADVHLGFTIDDQGSGPLSLPYAGTMCGASAYAYALNQVPPNLLTDESIPKLERIQFFAALMARNIAIVMGAVLDNSNRGYLASAGFSKPYPNSFSKSSVGLLLILLDQNLFCVTPKGASPTPTPGPSATPNPTETPGPNGTPTPQPSGDPGSPNDPSVPTSVEDLKSVLLELSSALKTLSIDIEATVDIRTRIGELIASLQTALDKLEFSKPQQVSLKKAVKATSGALNAKSKAFKKRKRKAGKSIRKAIKKF